MRLQLEALPDTGSQLQLVTDLARARGASRRTSPSGAWPALPLTAFVEDVSGHTEAWMRRQSSVRVIDRFVATYMPPGPGTASGARLDWWLGMLRARLAAQGEPAEGSVDQVWTPTFNVGTRIGHAFLAGREFTLQLYVPPEDAGL